MKRTALFEEHRKLGGRLVDFGGWELPVQYTGVIDEHLACRSAAGLFDVSHMGEITAEGPGSMEFLDRIVSNDVSKIEIGMAQYSALLRPDGGIVDDLIVYRRGPEKYFVVVNASNTEKDFAWMERAYREGGSSFRLENESGKWAQIAIQGPLSEIILEPLTPARLSEVKTFLFSEREVAGVQVLRVDVRETVCGRAEVIGVVGVRSDGARHGAGQRSRRNGRSEGRESGGKRGGGDVCGFEGGEAEFVVRER